MGEASFIGTLNSIRAILMKRYLKKKYILSIAFICGILAFSAYNFFAFAQYNSSKLMPPPPVPSQEAKEAANDSSTTRYRIKSTLKVLPILPPRQNTTMKQAVMSFALK